MKGYKWRDCRMKKLILIFGLLLLCNVSIQAEQLTAFYSDAILADTNGTRIDTIYTSGFDASEYTRLWFDLEIEGFLNDTVFAADSFFVAFQSSGDNINWTSHVLGDTALYKILKGANDTTVTTTVGIDRDSSYCGSFGRIRILHRNALSNQQALTANVYQKKFTVWISGIKND